MTRAHLRCGPTATTIRRLFGAHSLIAEVSDVRLSATTVEVFFRHRRVASHLRSYKPGYTTDPAHMPGSHRRHASWAPARIVSWARKTGPATAKLAEAVLASRPRPEQGFRTCLGIVRLGERDLDRDGDTLFGGGQAVDDLQPAVDGVSWVADAPRGQVRPSEDAEETS